MRALSNSLIDAPITRIQILVSLLEESLVTSDSRSEAKMYNLNLEIFFDFKHKRLRRQYTECSTGHTGV